MLQSAGQALAEGRISVLDPRRLRLLAVWAAVFVNTRSWPAMEAAKAFLRFETQPGALARAREAALGDAADARGMGLPQFIPDAAAQLAAYATTCSDPLGAAMEAVSYAVKATAWRDVERIMKTDGRTDDFPRIRDYLVAYPQMESQCEAAARPRFADACRLFVVPLRWTAVDHVGERPQHCALAGEVGNLT